MSTSDMSNILEHSWKYGSSALDFKPKEIPLLGYPLHHSLAPLVHNALFKFNNLPWNYYILESKDPNDLLVILKNSKSTAAAVTMPHKVNFMSFVDDVTPEARAIGAINTVFSRIDKRTGESRLIGTNTDCIGIGQSFTSLPTFTELHTRGQQRPALVIGGGGAARSAIYALHHILGVQEIYMVSRLESETSELSAWFSQVQQNASSSDHPPFKGKLRAVHSVEDAKLLATPYYVVGAVPDFPPQTEGEKTAYAVTREFLGRSESDGQGVILEMCYHPKIRTALYEFSEQNGWQVIPGTVSMIWQAIAQHILWTEKELPDIQAVHKKVSNIVEDAIIKSSIKYS